MEPSRTRRRTAHGRDVKTQSHSNPEDQARVPGNEIANHPSKTGQSEPKKPLGVVMWAIRPYGWSFELPRRIVVTKQTSATVWVRATDPFGQPKERRIRKAGVVFPTFAEAKASLLTRAEIRLQCADDERSRAISALKEVREMTEPTS